jgi:competence protein ComEC
LFGEALFMRRPLLLVFMAYLTGLVLQRTFQPHPLGVVIALLLISSLFLARRWRFDGMIREKLWPAVLLLALAAGMIRYDWSESETRQKVSQVFHLSQEARVLIETTPAGAVEIRNHKCRWTSEPGRIYLQDQWQSFPIRLQVEGTFHNCHSLQPGDRVLMEGHLSPVQAATLPGGFNYREFLAARHIHGRFFIASGGLQVAGQVKRSLLQKWTGAATALRTRTLALIEKHLPQPASGLLGAILLGQRAELPDELSRHLKASGLMHITAVSGLHITFLVFFITLLLKSVGMTRRQVALTVIPLSFFFLAMIGFRLPTVRAVLMGLAVMVGFLTERDIDPLSSISAAGLLILLWSPLSAFQAGFQMSFAAVAALILLAPGWDQWPEKVLGFQPRGLIRWFWDLVGASLIAQAAVGPIAAWHFALWTPVGVLANVPAIPLVGLCLVVGLLFMLSGLLFPALAGWFSLPALFVLSALEAVVDFFGSLPGGHFFGAIPHPLWLAGWYGLLILPAARPFSLHWKKGCKPLSRPVAALLLVAVLVWLGVVLPDSSRLEIDFLSLGQADCIFLRFPGGGCLLVDGGRPGRKGDPLPPLVQYLHRRGIKRLDAVVLTHPQRDHIGNLPEVFEAFEVGTFFYSGDKVKSEDFIELAQAVEQEGCRVLQLKWGDRILGYSGAEMKVLSPTGPGLAVAPAADPNDFSVVLSCRYGDFSCLLTGDISQEVEKELFSGGLLKPHTVLKVPHHGSRLSTSEFLLEAVRPQVAVIQVGRNNYGHPHRETLSRLEQAGALVLRTDRMGTIRLWSDGKSYSIYTIGRGQND